jgi:hypothetical protein
MERDTRRFLLIMLVLALAVAAPLAYRAVRDELRPSLVEIRVVTATAGDPVLRDGPRRFAADESVDIALALRVERPLRGSSWLAPGERLELGGEAVPCESVDRWPEEDRSLRVFWFTVECPYLGGGLDATSAARRLQYRTYLAPELGRGIRAAGLPEAHHDDDFSGPGGRLEGGGTLRLYARAEVVGEADQLRPFSFAASPGPDRVGDPLFPALHRALPPTPGIRSAAGELLLLPGFEPEGDDPAARDQVTVAALGRPFPELVRQRLVTSSWTFAAVALTGDPGLDPAALADLGPVELEGPEPQRRGRPLAWGQEVLPGDLLASGRHYLVLVGDDGDGRLGLADPVLHCWRRPAEASTVGGALDPGTGTLSHLRLPQVP